MVFLSARTSDGPCNHRSSEKGKIAYSRKTKHLNLTENCKSVFNGAGVGVCLWGDKLHGLNYKMGKWQEPVSAESVQDEIFFGGVREFKRE